MKKILLAVAILSAGAAVFHLARQSKNRFDQEAGMLRQSWMVETQQAAAARSQQAGLAEHAGELRQSLALSRLATESAIWSALQTNRANRLPSKLGERLREELGFTNWQASGDYILVSKETIRSLNFPFIHRSGKLNDVAGTALAITPEERSQLEAAMEQAKSDFKDWALAHVQRGEPADDLVAQYSLPHDAVTARNISSDFFSSAARAVGRERTDMMRETARAWMNEIGISDRSTQLTIEREVVGKEQGLKVEIREQGRSRSSYLPMANKDFPKALRLIFPNGWAEVANREGFELPRRAPKK